MNSCPTSEMLERLLSGALTDEQGKSLREHLVDCQPCQGALDRLTDNPELRLWASGSGLGQTPLPEETRWLRQLEKLHASPQSGTSGPGGPAQPFAAGLSFLGLPECAGDLGTLGSYRVVRELGRGGMGIVFLGYDQDLQRPVALKLLRADRVDAKARERFVREARTAAGLEHDHIVTVYAVATPPEAPPYLVMQYVEGPTLRERIATEKRLVPTEAAQVCRQVADGLAAAHHAGLVHRDIKPANVILDRVTGRAKIVDFGLARLTAAPSGMTQEGLLAGTPEYMSPEQVSQPDGVDARSDVYSLGVTFYEALTGEVPFRGLSHLVLQQVLHEEPLPVRRLNDAIPRELETICLKALAKEPGRRYQTAQELADDLGRWLNNEPIRARPVGVVGKVSHWCRRKPALASVLALLALVVTGGLAGVTWQWLRAEANYRLARDAQEQAQEQQRRAEANYQWARDAQERAQEQQRRAEANYQWARDAQERARDQQRRAEDHFQLAREAVSQYMTKVSEDPRLRAHDLEDLRKQLLDAAANFYQKLVQQEDVDPKVQAERAHAYSALGVLTQEIGSKKSEALPYLQKAIEIFGQLVRFYPSEPEYSLGLGKSHRDLGYHFHRVAGHLSQAEETYKKGIEILRRLTQDHPSVPAYDSALADTYTGLADLYRATSPDKAEVFFKESLDLWERLTRADPAVTHYQTKLGQAYNSLAIWYGTAGRLSEAEPVFAKSLTIREQLVRDYPSLPEYRQQLALSQNNLGNIYRLTDRLDQAVASYKMALANREQLVREHPSMTTYQNDLAATLYSLGIVHEKAKQIEEAGNAFHKAYEILDRLATAHPSVLEYRQVLAKVSNDLGRVYRATNQSERAEQAHKKALALCEQLVQEHPQVAIYVVDLSRSYKLMADLMTDKEQPTMALDWYGRAIEILEPVIQREPRHVPGRGFLRSSREERASLLSREKRFTEALADWDRVIELADASDSAAPRFQRARTLAHLRQHAQATAAVDALLESQSASGKNFYRSACVYALSAAAAGDDAKLADDYAVRAVELLRQTVAKGDLNVAHLKEPDLDALRARDDFQKLQSELAEKAKTDSPPVSKS